MTYRAALILHCMALAWALPALVGATAEPYLGAYIQGDQRYRGDIEAFERELGAPVSFYSTYRAYGMPFPVEWAEDVMARGRGMVFCWEPWRFGRPLEEVHEDVYLRRWAGTLSRCETPVLLVFGSEPNIPQDGRPVSTDLYRQKFRLVSDVMRRMAPRVEMVFSLSVPAVRRAPKASEWYYPGCEHVDWVAFTSYDGFFQGGELAWNSLNRSLEWAAELWPDKRLAITEVGCERLVPGTGKRLESFLRWNLQRHPQLEFISYFSYDSSRSTGKAKTVNYALRPNSEAMAALQWALGKNRVLTGPPPVSIAAAREACDRDPYLLRREALTALYLALPAAVTGRADDAELGAEEAGQWLRDNGIVSGFPDGKDRGGEAIAGFEIALLLSRTVDALGSDWRPRAGMTPVAYTPESFEMSDAVREAAQHLEKRGIITRAEVAEFRLYDSVRTSALHDLLARLQEK